MERTATPVILTIAEYDSLIDIAANRMRYNGYGSKKSIESNDSEEGRKQNRRVEFVLIKN